MLMGMMHQRGGKLWFKWRGGKLLGPALESTEHWTWHIREEGWPWRETQISSNRRKNRLWFRCYMSICGGRIFRKFSQKIMNQGHQLKVRVGECWTSKRKVEVSHPETMDNEWTICRASYLVSIHFSIPSVYYAKFLFPWNSISIFPPSLI